MARGQKVAPKYNPRVIWRRRSAIRRDRVITRQPRNQTSMVRRRDSSGLKRYPRKRDPMFFWRRSAGPAKNVPDGQAPYLNKKGRWTRQIPKGLQMARPNDQWRRGAPKASGNKIK